MGRPAFFAILCVAAFFASCEKSNTVHTQVNFTTQHHEKIIPNITVFVKYNTSEFPGYDPPDIFDDSAVSDDRGKVSFRDIPLGHHWFVGVGFDEEIKEQVIGNMDYQFDLRHLRLDTILYVGEE